MDRRILFILAPAVGLGLAAFAVPRQYRHHYTLATSFGTFVLGSTLFSLGLAEQRTEPRAPIFDVLGPGFEAQALGSLLAAGSFADATIATIQLARGR